MKMSFMPSSFFIGAWKKTDSWCPHTPHSVHTPLCEQSGTVMPSSAF